ncbi:MAG TPA: hypothetical protein VFH95_10790 [Candidatus Kapabacteria bacterium]|nr:hypothetical protein [Candidatus Kapabacteria bacterium]
MKFLTDQQTKRSSHLATVCRHLLGAEVAHLFSGEVGAGEHAAMNY